MLVLGIETSCDETAAAVLLDGTELLSSIVSDQIKIHSKYGGIVPELAGRSHIECIHPVIEQAIEEAGVTLKDIDLIAATMGPGLVASLLVGLNTAKGIAYALKKPLIGINHLEGHLLAIFLEEPVEFPFVALAVSGGHTELYRVDGFGKYRILGRTRDDAAGESFDKVAKMLKFGYPGGPVIEAKARSGDPDAHRFPRALLGNGSLDFSFSGLKTSVRNLLAKRERLDLSDTDISAGFQEAVIDVLVTKLMRACEQEELKRIVVSGGVAANGALRERVTLVGEDLGMKTYFPKPVYCTDNAAMIACAGYYRCRDNPLSGDNPLSLDASACLALDS
ncbi:MAG: tRNA (adenosine(37)-N6)-threonylcarbamoyltransferase complex transferase subunit TsaD [Nitrospinaceae bacterium]|nr:tRNA (adenosine(37)-N6)-threonylcarbamoyltransferase complex transferase subunit TsaD [Nitrospinaceae bacterium]